MRDEIRWFFGKPGDRVPTVDAFDLEAVWQVRRENRERLPGQKVGVGVEVYRAACQRGANVRAVWFRLAMITLLTMTEYQELTLEDDGIRGKLFSVAARIPMTWPPEGPTLSLPFDTEVFVREIRSLA